MTTTSDPDQPHVIGEPGNVNEVCRYCNRDATVPVIDERMARTDVSGNKYRRYCLACERWLPMCSAKYFRTHPRPHVLPADEDPQSGGVLPVAEYEESADWCPVLHLSAGGTDFVGGSNPEQVESSNPREKLIEVLGPVIDEELACWEASMRDLGVLQQQLVDSERIVFGAKLFIWGKLLGLVVTAGSPTFDNTAGDETDAMDPIWIRNATWAAIEKRAHDIRRICEV